MPYVLYLQNYACCKLM